MKNQLKTAVLLAVLTALLLWIGSFWGQGGLIFGLIFALVINFGSYFFSDKIVLAIYRAKQVEEKDAPELYKIVREVAHLAQIPMPKVYIIPSANPNALATGRNPKHAVVACTQGIIELLSKDELKGVIAHEMSHIKNRDILIQTIAATIAGVISYIAMVARWGAIFGGFGGDRDNGGSNAIQLLVLAIITPILAMILQLAISRSREYLADESAAKTLHNSFGLSNALEKLEKGIKHNPMVMGGEATSALFIANPFSAKGFINILSTHPPIEERIKKLRDMQV
ncbi:zinc metalloprotease HtpX [Candidatus Woesearchaeota archaeon]|nr:zinc metalloprotease HtpX [Candidatus Woesearchaeota archaeon]